MNNAINDLTALFEEAKSLNEFEFVMTLLNYKSIGAPHVQANLHEWFEAMSSYINHYRNSNDKEKTRMAALLYSTFFENSDFYNIIGNLCRVKLGLRSSSYLLWKTKKYERLLGIGEKEDYLTEMLADTGKEHIIAFFKENHYTEIRNTYFHSAYSLDDDNYILHDSEAIVINNVGHYSFSISGFFYPLVENVISFFEAFKQLYLNHFASYQEDIEIGTCSLGADAVIIGTAQGLGGIRIPKAVQFFGKWHDSGIWFDPIFGIFGAHNLTFNFPKIETIEIEEQLNRYENKPNIRRDDIAFFNLIDKISERASQLEIKRALVLLIKIGDKKFKEMEDESNIHKKNSLPKGILPFYKRAIELNQGRYEMKQIETKVIDLEK